MESLRTSRDREATFEHECLLYFLVTLYEDDLPFLPRSLNAFLYLPENTVVVDKVIFLTFPLIPFTDQGDLFFSLRINYIQFNFQIRSTFVPRQNSTQLKLLNFS
jgi:hypothetical protein